MLNVSLTGLPQYYNETYGCALWTQIVCALCPPVLFSVCLAHTLLMQLRDMHKTSLYESPVIELSGAVYFLAFFFL